MRKQDLGLTTYLWKRKKNKISLLFDNLKSIIKWCPHKGDNTINESDLKRETINPGANDVIVIQSEPNFFQKNYNKITDYIQKKRHQRRIDKEQRLQDHIDSQIANSKK